MKLLVTGAGGCLGGRLVQRIRHGGDVDVRAMVHTPVKAVRLTRAPVELTAVDMADLAAVRAAVDGCDVVIHSAHDFVHPEKNLLGATNVARACVEHGVKRLVHLSSASVYEPASDAVIDESTPIGTGLVGSDPTRIVAELAAVATAGHALPVVVLQPGIVYGPYSPHWTMGVAGALRRGKVVVTAEGAGICNAVYVDDVVEAAYASAVNDVAAGKYLVTGPAPVTWAAFYRALESALEVDSLVLDPATGEEPGELSGPSMVRRSWEAARAVRNLPAATPVRRFVGETLGPRRMRALKDVVRSRLPAPVTIPTPREMALYRSKSEISDARARQAIGWSPRFDFESGMGLTAEFVRWSNL
jgi:nucleoside-diphosphate-sugar epimerase